jgi:hypothetical protein
MFVEALEDAADEAELAASMCYMKRMEWELRYI